MKHKERDCAMFVTSYSGSQLTMSGAARNGVNAGTLLLRMAEERFEEFLCTLKRAVEK